MVAIQEAGHSISHSAFLPGLCQEQMSLMDVTGSVSNTVQPGLPTLSSAEQAHGQPSRAHRSSHP